MATLRAPSRGGVLPYLVGGVGAYVKFSEARSGLNGGAGVRRRIGRAGQLAEVRYHRVTQRFEEAAEVEALLPVPVGLVLDI
jgi:hypothetical protein